MDSFAGKIAVVTGGGTGMGRELATQLAAEGCSVAICDVSATNMADTLLQAEEEAPAGVVVSTFVADVSPRHNSSPSASTWRPCTTPITSTCCSTTPASAVAPA